MKNLRNDVVLIVDDEADIQFFLTHFARKRNLQPVAVGTKQDAIKAYESLNPGMIFLDNHLPDGYGVDIVHNLKKKTPETPVIMISAHDSAEDRKKAFKEGVDFFLSKPFSMQDLRTILDSVQSQTG